MKEKIELLFSYFEKKDDLRIDAFKIKIWNSNDWFSVNNSKMFYLYLKKDVIKYDLFNGLND